MFATGCLYLEFVCCFCGCTALRGREHLVSMDTCELIINGICAALFAYLSPPPIFVSHYGCDVGDNDDSSNATASTNKQCQRRRSLEILIV